MSRRLALIALKDRLAGAVNPGSSPQPAAAPRRPSSHVIVSIQNRVRLAFAAVLLLGAAVSAFVYLNGRAVLEVSEPLLHQQLPLLETLSRLQLEVAEQEPILYEYYATTERPAFQQRFGENDSAIQRDLDGLSRVLGETGSLAGVRAQYARLRELAAALDDTLRVYGTDAVDWDRAREVLVEVSKAGRTVNGELSARRGSSRARSSWRSPKPRLCATWNARCGSCRS